jgi:hypothetical protein
MKIDRLRLAQFGNLELLAKQVVEGFITGLHKSPYHGFSVEFAEHRLYNEGESTRHIDWKVFAKTDRLYTKRYEEETNLRCQILLDNSPTMYFPKNDKILENGNIHFSDNYVDLLPGEEKAIEFDSKGPVSIADLQFKMLVNE